MFAQKKTFRTKKSVAEPRYMTFEAQNFLLNKDTWLLTLTFGRCGDMYTSGLSGGGIDTKIIVFLLPINLLISQKVQVGTLAVGTKTSTWY